MARIREEIDHPRAEGAANISRRAVSLTLLAFATSFATTACKVGGSVTGAPSQPIPTAIISSPIITAPATSPYYSNGNNLIISGICLDGSSITLGGSTTAAAPCADSAFSFTIPQSTDGVYFYLITQTHPSYGISTPSALTYIHKSSVTPPILVSPTGPDYYSGSSVLTVNGKCETGSAISLGGDGIASAPCMDSQFTLVLPKGADGTYSLSVVQTDPAGNSASVPLRWIKQALNVSPTNTDLEVMTKQAMSFSGGSGLYGLSIVSANSGADAAVITETDGSLSYRPGKIAGVIDTLQAYDRLGTSVTVTIRTVAGAPDHVVLPSDGGDAQTTKINSPLAANLKVRIVDRYGNGIAAYPILIQTISGDMKLSGTGLKTTDLQGYAQISATAGISAVKSTVVVSSLNGSLPDLAGSGHGRLLMTQTATTSGTGQIGGLYPSGLGPNATAVEDFNGDGIPDLAVINPTEPSIGILLGRGNGVFSTMTKIRPICTEPTALAAGDLDQDGKPDLVVVCGGTTDKYAVLTGKGDGAFNSAVITATGASERQPNTVLLADLDNDGNVDIATLSAYDQAFNVHHGDGHGNFSAPVSQAVGTLPIAMAAADFTGDGYKDIVVADVGTNKIYLYSNNHNRTFTLSPNQTFTNSGPAAMVARDFDGDGLLDIAVAETNDNMVTLYAYDGALGFNQLGSANVGDAPSSLAAADFNGDGKIDLAVANNGSSSITILRNVGLGNFALNATLNTASNPIGIQVGDFTGHGLKDIVVASSSSSAVHLIPARSGGSFGLAYAAGSSPSGAAIADFDGDGNPDAVVANSGSNNLSLLKGDGKGGFTLVSTISAGSSPAVVQAADLNGDGLMDLLILNSTGTLRVALGIGDGTFAASVSYGVGVSPSALVAADLNHDGYPDIAVANNGSSNMSVLINRGNGTFNTRVNYSAGDGPTAIVAADFNGDQVLDLAVTNQTTNSVSVLIGNANTYGNANGTFQTALDLPVDFSPVALVAADFNGDGKIDLVSANNASISFLRGVGDGSFHTHVDYAAGTNVNGMVLGDFNGDGNPDVLVTNGTNQVFTLMTSNHNGVFSQQTPVSTEFNINGIAEGDLNKDGAIDLLLIDGIGASFQPWLGH